ncbi:MAG: VOC family protein [Solirubrobacterales bacterium]|nr:VOC family protein [Solirubrobacterales bacterium]
MSTITPVIPYRDLRAAIDFLCDAFGFERQWAARRRGRRAAARRAPAGRRRDHADGLADGRAGHAQTYVVVEDADAHHDRAKAAGAQITMELRDTDHGSRDYAAKDLDGNTWYFGTYRPLG